MKDETVFARALKKIRNRPEMEKIFDGNFIDITQFHVNILSGSFSSNQLDFCCLFLSSWVKVVGIYHKIEVKNTQN